MNKDPLHTTPGLHTAQDDAIGVGGLLRQFMREVPDLFTKGLD